MASGLGQSSRILENPRWLTMLFSSTKYAWVWLFVRIYLGIQWLEAGWHKATDPGWVTTGASLQAFWARIVVVPESGRPAISYDWYRAFIQFMLDAGWYTWFGKLVAYGEVLVGIALLLGILTGIAAFFGALMNWNFMLAGTASTNPVLGILGLGVLAAWKIAGWWGADRWVLSRIGAPWQPGTLFGGLAPKLSGESEMPVARAVEQWLRIIIGAAIHAAALAYMDGPLQIIVSIIGILILAVTGLGMFFVTPAGESQGSGFQGHGGRA